MRTILAPGTSTELTWSVRGATELRIDPGIGPVSGTSITITPPAGPQRSLTATTYVLTAMNASGDAAASVTVTVRPMPIAGWYVSNPVVSPGYIRTYGGKDLDWSVTDADTASVDNGIGPLLLSQPCPSCPREGHGTLWVSPTKTTVYTLTATNDAGTVSEPLEVEFVTPVFEGTWLVSFSDGKTETWTLVMVQPDRFAKNGMWPDFYGTTDGVLKEYFPAGTVTGYQLAAAVNADGTMSGTWTYFGMTSVQPLDFTAIRVGD